MEEGGVTTNTTAVGAVIVMVAETDFVESATEIAVIVTVEPEGMAEGAV
jgi:hypothetical protein